MSKIQFTLRVDETLSKKLKAIAEKEMRSLNSQYEYFLSQCVADYEKKNGDISLSHA